MLVPEGDTSYFSSDKVLLLKIIIIIEATMRKNTLTSFRWFNCKTNVPGQMQIRPPLNAKHCDREYGHKSHGNMKA